VPAACSIDIAALFAVVRNIPQFIRSDEKFTIQLMPNIRKNFGGGKSDQSYRNRQWGTWIAHFISARAGAVNRS
jgi:hypothetical protein